MKILHITNVLNKDNGVVNMLLSMVPYQISQGYEVTILALVETHMSVKENFESLGVKVITLLPIGSSRKSPSLLFKVGKEMRKHDIVHLHLFPAFYWGALAKKIFNIRCKLVCTEHATMNNRQRAWMRPIERFIYKQYDEIVAISGAVCQSVTSHLKCGVDVNVIYNGIDVSRFYNALPINRACLDLPEDAIVVTHVARFGPEKDQSTLLKALAQLSEQYHGVFVGDGRLLKERVAEAESLGISNRIHFLGVRGDVPSILKMSDIIVMSSHYEGFGLAALEGMAAKKPVIASAVTGMMEVVESAGLLFAHGDYVELAQHIQKLVESESYYSSVAENCYNRALAYDISKTAECYDLVYRR